MLNPSMTASSNPFRIGSWGWGTLVHQNHAAGEENRSIMVGMCVSLCLASQKSSEREFFVSTRMNLGVKLLTGMPLLEHTCATFFNELLASLITFLLGVP